MLKIHNKITENLKEYLGFHKSVYVLFLATIINKLGNFVLPFMTLFLTKNLGFSEAKVGLIVMIGAGFYVPGSIIGGKLADSHGRKKVLISSQILAALSLIPCAIYSNNMYTAGFLFSYIFFIGVTEPANISMITDLTHKENRREIYSFIYMGVNIGTAVGPLIAGFLFSEHVRLIFIGNALALIMSIILLTFFVKETLPEKSCFEEKKHLLHEHEKGEVSSFISAFSRRPVLIYFSIASIIYSFIYSQVLFAIPLQVNEVFGNSGAKIFGTIMTVSAITIVSLTTIVTRVFKKFNPINNIIFGGIFYCFGFGILYFVKDYKLFILSTVIWSIGEILVFTNQAVFISKYTPISHRGRFNAVLPLITGAGRAIGPAIMGQFISTTSIRSSWILIVFLCIFAILIMYFNYLFESFTLKRVKI